MRIRTVVVAAVFSISMFAACGRCAAEADRDYGKRVSELAKKLADPSAEVRQDGEIGLELLPPQAFPAMDAVADDPSLDPAARQKLRTIVERERPGQEARLRHARAWQQQFDWMEKTALEAYDRLAKHDARWDAAAREGIHQFTQTPGGEHDSAREPLRKAIAAGCDDPLILYMRAASLMTSGKPSDEEVRLYERAQRPMMAGDYPAYYKLRLAIDGFRIAYRAISIHVHEQHRKVLNNREERVLTTWADEQLQFWPRFVKDGAPAPLLTATATDIIDRHRIVGADLKKVHDRLALYLRKVLPNGPDVPVFEGGFYITWAWQARGNGTAATVTEQGWKLFTERLAMARQALEKAYAIDPTDPGAPTLMLTVEMGQGSSRDSMEMWFKRALATYPDNLAACYEKLTYLQPKWFGSEEDMVQFGHECYESGKWAGKIPLVLAEARIQQSTYHANNVDGFFADPEVWADLQRVYEPYLRVNSGDSGVRSDDAYLACRAHHWDVARRQFKILGDNVKLSWYMFYSPAYVKKYRDLAEHDGQVPAAPTTRPSATLPAGANSNLH